jgi:hypothetical protein
MDDWSPPEPGALPEELLQLVKPELQPGERLLWAATAIHETPVGTRSPYYPFYVMAVSFGVIAVSLFLVFGPFRARFGSDEILLTEIVLIAIIAWLISCIVALFSSASRWAVHGRFATNYYALTDCRAIIWVPSSGLVQIHSFTRGSIKTIYRIEYPDGSGSVRFHYPTEEGYQPPAFERVANVRFVEDLARRTLIDTGPSAYV